MSDVLVRTISQDGGVAVRALVGTGLLREAARRHGTRPTATHALGRTLMGALLLASGLDEDETVQIQLRGDGPLGNVTAIADGGGRVRGFVSRPETDLPPRGDQPDVGGAVGRGVLAVVRFRPGWREPYSGLVPIRTGEIASDLTWYLAESEQKPSALALGVALGPDGEAVAAGGYLAQALPDADDETVARVETVVHGLPPVTDLLGEGLDAAELAKLVLAGVGHRALHASEPRFACPCTRQRVLAAMAVLGREELTEIRRRGETLETHCRFCGERYLIGGDELGALSPDA